MKASIALVAAAAALTGGLACADDNQSQGWMLSAGNAYVHVNSQTSDFVGPFTQPGVSLNVKSADTLFLAISKHMTDNVDIELLGGTPPKHNIDGKGLSSIGSVPYDGVKIATATELAPTLVANYHFFAPSATIRPYFGFGFNYTHFYDVKMTDAGNRAVGGPTSVTLSDSIGPVAQIGITAKLADHWKVDVSVVKAEVQSHTVSTTGGISRGADINFNPLVSVLALDYDF